jgi:uncharacterized protein (DUF362 family)
VAGDAQSSDRRRFLQALGATAVGLTGCGSSCAGKISDKNGTRSTTVIRNTEASRSDLPSQKPRVVVVKTKKALTQGYDVDRGALRAMLEAGLIVFSGQKDAAAALSRYVRPDERIGLKINGLAGRNAATHVELVDELSLLLGKANVEGRKQIVFDRFTSDLMASGFVVRPHSDGYQCIGNDDAGHEDQVAQMPSSASRLSRVLTRLVDGVLNLPILKQHMMSGLTGALKNNFGCIHNPNKMHIDNCDPYIAEVNAVPEIRSKQRLVIMDALRPVVDNGPSYQPGMGEVANLLLFATDLVAIDTVGLEILEELRAKRALPPLAKVGLTPTYLATAQELGLGVSDRAGIEIVRIEV